MSTYRLKNLLLPRSVALVGASARQGSVGRAILGNIRKANFAGNFGVVNPRHTQIDGFATVARLDLLPFVPELVVIAHFREQGRPRWVLLCNANQVQTETGTNGPPPLSHLKIANP